MNTDNIRNTVDSWLDRAHDEVFDLVDGAFAELDKRVNGFLDLLENAVGEDKPSSEDLPVEFNGVRFIEADKQNLLDDIAAANEKRMSPGQTSNWRQTKPEDYTLLQLVRRWGEVPEDLKTAHQKTTPQAGYENENPWNTTKNNTVGSFFESLMDAVEKNRNA